MPSDFLPTCVRVIEPKAFAPVCPRVRLVRGAVSLIALWAISLEALARCRGRCLWRAPAPKVYKVEYAR